MVFIISVAQQKGGAGKTTIAAHLAVAFQQKKKKVAMIDGDPQASLTRWYEEREKLGEKFTKNMTFSQAPGWRITSEISKLRRTHDVIIIDNASGLDMDTKATMRNADLTVVPVQPSPADVWATEAVTSMAEKEGLNILLVMNRVTARSRLACLFSRKLPSLSDTQIGNRIAFAGVLQDGMTVQEDSPRSTAAREVDELFREVLKHQPKPQKRKSGMDMLRETARSAKVSKSKKTLELA